MNDPSSLDSGIHGGWTTEVRAPMGWTEITLEYYAEINPNRNKFGIGILSALRFQKSSGKLSNPPILLREIKETYLQIYAFFTMP